MKITLLLIAFVALFNAAQSQNTAYLVTYDSAGIVVPKKCFTIGEVKQLFDEKLKGLENGGVYMDFYIEKKRILANGKMKRIKIKR